MNTKLRTVEMTPGWETIYSICEKAVLMAHEKNCIVHFQFNGVDMNVTPEDDLDTCKKYFETEQARLEAEYKDSDSYKIQQEKQLLEEEVLNSRASSLTEQFKHLNLACNSLEDKEKLLKWLIEYQPYSDSTLVNADDTEICRRLERAGFVANESAGREPEDADTEFRYIVGQAISTMKFLAMHQCVAMFAEDWLNKYSNH